MGSQLHISKWMTFIKTLKLKTKNKFCAGIENDKNKVYILIMGNIKSDFLNGKFKNL